MKAAEIVEIGEKMMKMLSGADIRMDDWRHLGLWREYVKAVSAGAKVSGVVAGLAERYGISEAGVWRVVRRFKREIPAANATGTAAGGRRVSRGDSVKGGECLDG